MSMYAVIMAGGRGTRFWPLSRSQYPKQFIDILGTGKSLLQSTYERMKKVVKKTQNIYIVAADRYYPLVKKQLKALKEQQYLGEPVGRNTAPCILYSAIRIYKKDNNAKIIVTPSDHYIEKDRAFINNVRIAFNGLDEHPDAIFTIGIKPTRPDTGYGYIQFVKQKGKKYYPVKTFTEKPTLEVAKTFLQSGDFLWNAGIFIFKSATILEAYKTYLPDMFELFKPLLENDFNPKEEKYFIQEVYSKVKNISIDYGIMEKAKKVFVVPSTFRWSDLGTWRSLYQVMPKDFAENAVGNQTRAIVYESYNNMIFSTQAEKVIVLKGVNDMIVVDTPDAMLLCRLEDEQYIRTIVKELQERYEDKYI